MITLGNKEISSDESDKMRKTTLVPYGQVLTVAQMSKTSGGIQGIGNSYDKDI